MNTPTPNTDPLEQPLSLDESQIVPIENETDIKRLRQLALGYRDDYRWQFNKTSQLEQELNEATKAYTTVKEHMHSYAVILETLLDRCCDYADGTPDATPLARFCNEMIGLSNGIMLKDIHTLRAERDTLKEQLKNAYNYICLSHTDRERSELVTGCPICKLEQLREVADELARRHASWMRNVPNFKLQLDEETQELYSQLPHVKQKENTK